MAVTFTDNVKALKERNERIEDIKRTWAYYSRLFFQQERDHFNAPIRERMLSWQFNPNAPVEPTTTSLVTFKREWGMFRGRREFRITGTINGTDITCVVYGRNDLGILEP